MRGRRRHHDMLRFDGQAIRLLRKYEYYEKKGSRLGDDVFLNVVLGLCIIQSDIEHIRMVRIR